MRLSFYAQHGLGESLTSERPAGGAWLPRVKKGRNEPSKRQEMMITTPQTTPTPVSDGSILDFG